MLAVQLADGEKLIDASARNNAELGEVRTDRVGELRVLAVEHQPYAVQHHHALLLFRGRRKLIAGRA